MGIGGNLIQIFWKYSKQANLIADPSLWPLQYVYMYSQCLIFQNNVVINTVVASFFKLTLATV